MADGVFFQEEWVVMRAQVRVWGGTCPVVGNRRRAWRQRWGVLLEVFDEDGRRGVGEASPLPGFSRDTLAECHRALSAWCRALPLTVNMFSMAKPPAVMPLPPAARFAVESALLDLQGKRGDLPVPVTRLLRRELDGPIYVSKLLSGRRVDSLAAQVRRGLEQGFHTFKLKIGGVGSFADDLRVVQRLRAALPGGWRLRLDANGSWDLAHAPRYLEQLADVEVELVEDPVPAGELEHLPRPGVPVAVDEPLGDEERLLPLLRARSCSLWVLKPTVLGGFTRCRQLVTLADTNGIKTIISHCFEGPVGLAAVRAVAQLLGWARHPDADLIPKASVGDVRWQDVYAQGVDLHPALTAFPALPVPGGGAAELYPSNFPGLGVQP